MIDQEFARLSKLNRSTMTRNELAKWRREFARRNKLERDWAALVWDTLPEVRRVQIKKEWMK